MNWSTSSPTSHNGGSVRLVWNGGAEDVMRLRTDKVV
jgi:hypothetical protein